MEGPGKLCKKQLKKARVFSRQAGSELFDPSGPFGLEHLLRVNEAYEDMRPPPGEVLDVTNVRVEEQESLLVDLCMRGHIEVSDLELDDETLEKVSGRTIPEAFSIAQIKKLVREQNNVQDILAGYHDKLLRDI